MTKKQKKDYLKDSTRCPYCHSDNIASDNIQADGIMVYSNVECSDCGKSWSDIFTLTNVEETYIYAH